MAKIPLWRKAALEDFPASPDWFRNFFNIINPFMDDTNRALLGQITIEDNMMADKFTTAVTHNVTKTLKVDKTQLPGTPVALVFGDTGGEIITGHKFRTLGGGNIELTVLFSGSPTNPVTITFFVIGQ